MRKVINYGDKTEENLIIALGYFDAVHKGHKKVLEKAVSIAKSKGVTPAVLIFTGGKHGKDIFNLFEREIGFEKLNYMHVHFSKIMYSNKGEVKHLTFEDEVYGPCYKEFITAVKEKGISPYVICESAGTQDKDAKAMQDFYKSL